MKKTFYIIGALILGAATVFGVNSCGNSNNTSGAQTDAAATDSTVTAAAGSIVYIDMTKIQSEYQMAIDLGADVEAKISEKTKALESKTKSIEAEIKRKQDKFTAAATEFQEKYQKGLYTETAGQVKLQELQKMETEFNNYVAQKDQEIQKEQVALQNMANEELFVMNNTINDAIATFIAKYNQEKKFAMILLSQGDIPNDGATTLGNPVVAADPSLDITNDVLAGLNAEYNASK
jgi:outer membrane protein